MNIRGFFLIIVSRLVAGLGMTLGLISTVYSLWNFFFSSSPCRYILGLLGVLGFFIGYGLYKFALTYIYDEWDEHR